MTNQSRQSLGLFAIALLFALTALPHDADAQRRGGGGRGGGGRGGGGRGGGGGGFRAGGGRPSGGISRPSGGISRPSGGISRPSGGTGFRDAGFSGGARTSIGGNLSGSTFNRNTSRPSTGVGAGGIANRPGAGGGIANRPGAGAGANRPGQGGNINRGEWNAANIDRDVNIDVDNGWGWGYGAGWGVAAAVTGAAITAAAIGSTVYSLPPSCSAVVVGGVTYQQCGSTWYQPQFVGSTVEYIVVSPP